MLHKMPTLLAILGLVSVVPVRAQVVQEIDDEALAVGLTAAALALFTMAYVLYASKIVWDRQKLLETFSLKLATPPPPASRIVLGPSRFERYYELSESQPWLSPEALILPEKTGFDIGSYRLWRLRSKTVPDRKPSSREAQFFPEPAQDDLFHVVRFSREQLLRLYDEFVEMSVNGDIRQAAFASVLERILECNRSYAENYAELVFKTFDRDNSGGISCDEYLTFMCISGYAVPYQDKLTTLYAVYGNNSNLSGAEVKEMLLTVFELRYYSKDRLWEEVDPEKYIIKEIVDNVGGEHAESVSLGTFLNACKKSKYLHSLMVALRGSKFKLTTVESDGAILPSRSPEYGAPVPDGTSAAYFATEPMADVSKPVEEVELSTTNIPGRERKSIRPARRMSKRIEDTVTLYQSMEGSNAPSSSTPQNGNPILDLDAPKETPSQNDQNESQLDLDNLPQTSNQIEQNESQNEEDTDEDNTFGFDTDYSDNEETKNESVPKEPENEPYVEVQDETNAPEVKVEALDVPEVINSSTLPTSDIQQSSSNTTDNTNKTREGSRKQRASLPQLGDDHRKYATERERWEAAADVEATKERLGNLEFDFAFSS
eukprot:m.89721 g.89721  ORF g.89721 m.89721 type:complete len:601 (+) comp13236_c0_seq3:210-2012(+)